MAHDAVDKVLDKSAAMELAIAASLAEISAVEVVLVTGSFLFASEEVIHPQ
ncbi:MAG: hypothetical protein F2840_06635 [Actinobacteria bacterium]|uniref:Unannotated protein n=1 Tax=freshwater metagenome TaxID=449393 RepID=A0A6J7JW85_9ZZZZ|nr:hypothetical protein [Actinomycetota bacterium]